MKRFFSRIGITGLILFALLALRFIVWRVNLAHGVNAKLAAIRAAGLPTSGAELNAYYPAVPDSENAALVMTQAFALMRNYSYYQLEEEVRQIQNLPRMAPLTVRQKQLMAICIRTNAAAIAKMREAIRLPKSRYPIDCTAGAETPLPHLTKLRSLAQIAEFNALLTIRSGRTDIAAESITDILGLAKTLDNEPLEVSQLARAAMIGMAAQTQEQTLSITNFTESELLGFQRNFTEAEKTNLMTRAMIGERATLIPYFCSLQGWYHAKLLFEQIQQGKYVTNSPDPKIGWWKAKWLETSGFVQSDLLFYLNSTETNIAIASLSAPKNLVLADVEKMEIKKANQQHHDLAAVFLPGSPGLNKSEIRCFAMVRLATTSVAIERFRLDAKRLPQSLDELAPRFLPAVPTDPFDGQPLRYRRLAKGYLIYSVGQDGQDDGGREKPSDLRPGDKTTYDITFTVER
jgi:hypothetical protein